MHGQHQIEVAAEPWQHGARQSGLHLEAHARSRMLELPQQRRQHARGIVVHDAKPYRAAQRGHGEGRGGFVGQRQHPARIAAEDLALGGQADRAAGAREQGPAEPRLQLLHLHAHRRLGPVQRIGRTGEAAMLDDPQKRPQQLGVDVHILVNRIIRSNIC